MDHNPKPIITRIPPSPTGHLHIGTARTALFNYLFAKQNNGQMLYRSEDTDKARSSDEYTEEIIEGLHWLGVTWDNDPIVKQSERTEIYKKYLTKLIEEDKAYISEEASKQNPDETVSLVRLRNPNKLITFEDLIRGEIQFDTTELGDFVIARAIDDALYHFTVVVDDAEMGITHILRGEDHISNTPRQILIQEAIGFSRPIYAHLPLILAADKSKLSKRNGTVAIDEYIQMGILPEALVNYLALLGWNPGTEKEFFTTDELLQEFSIDKIQKGGAIFDLKRLTWLNKLHLEALPEEQQIKYVVETAKEISANWSEMIESRFTKLYSTILERYHSKQEIRTAIQEGEYDYIYEQPKIELSQVMWKNDNEVAEVVPRLQSIIQLLQETDFSTTETLKEKIFPYAEKIGKGEVLWPFRIALTGKDKSPDPFTVSYTLGKEETIARLDKVCAKINTNEI